MQLSTVIFFATVFFASSIVEGKRYGRNDAEWDHIVYTQQWAQSSCEYQNATGRHQCEIPSGTYNWTVHGLWPSMGNTRGPNYCNDSWSFDPSKLECCNVDPAFIQMFKRAVWNLQYWGILPDLKIQWPNLFADTSLYSFWEHEWTKHGTCAASLPSLRGEMKYFSVGLSLNRKYNILSTLSKRGVIPSQTKTYDVADVMGVLKEAYGVNACLSCEYSRDLGQLLYQVELCLGKDLGIIDCPSCSRSCRDSEKLVYHPIQHDEIY